MIFKPTKEDKEKYGMTEIEKTFEIIALAMVGICLLYTSPSPRDRTRSRMPSSA